MGVSSTARSSRSAWLVLAALAASCGGEAKPLGGLMLVVSAESDEIDRLDLAVESEGQVLRQRSYRVPMEAPLPTTLGIASNGSPTASVTITISGWRADVPVDRRDAIVTQVPTDRVAMLVVVLSSICSSKVELVGDEAVSTCGEKRTCNPVSGACESAEIDARSLPEYQAGAENMLDPLPGAGAGGTEGAGGMPGTGTPDAGAPGAGAPAETGGAGGQDTGDLGGQAGADDTPGQGGEPPGQAGQGGDGGSQGPPTGFFVTSTTSNTGNLGGLAVADNLCQTLANAAGFGQRTFRAYLSTSTVNARDRIGTGPWFNANGLLVANDLVELHARTGNVDVFVDENGDRINGQWTGSPSPNEHDVLTGSNADGTVAGSATCSDWTSSDGADVARVGHTDGLGPGQSTTPPYNSWNSAHDTPGGCDDTAPGGGAGRLYCFAID